MKPMPSEIAKAMRQRKGKREAKQQEGKWGERSKDRNNSNKTVEHLQLQGTKTAPVSVIPVLNHFFMQY